MRAFPLDNVVSHWSKLIENFSTSSDKFYEAVDTALDRREIPEVRIHRTTWNEGGVLSPEREYLRIEGSGFAFDLCAAPFGKGFFFSWWLIRKPPSVSAHLLLFIVGAWGISRVLGAMVERLANDAPRTLDPVALLTWAVVQSPFFVGVAAVILAMALVGLLERAGKRDLGDALAAVPGLGWIYEHLFSQVTYYRLDTAAMFRAAVHSAVTEVIDDLLVRKGLRALRPEEQKPQFDRLESPSEAPSRGGEPALQP